MIQLRRYEIVPGELDAFVDWWRATMPALRTKAGFTIEFAYVDKDAGEFVWAVSVPGTVEDFARVDAAYRTSEDRRSVFAGLPERVAKAHVGFVWPVLED
ncbi:NIPSNAP family containing protein [Streptomyces sp. NPDC093544]|uniref:NIPSNAP family containing protein n=1 Tax=Streptomyces sp. NPDC093544 TaxID=3155200 RepID=UPI003416161E